VMTPEQSLELFVAQLGRALEGSVLSPPA
jgi:hypothetical protein